MKGGAGLSRYIAGVHQQGGACGWGHQDGGGSGCGHHRCVAVRGDVKKVWVVMCSGDVASSSGVQCVVGHGHREGGMLGGSGQARLGHCRGRVAGPRLTAHLHTLNPFSHTGRDTHTSHMITQRHADDANDHTTLRTL